MFGTLFYGKGPDALAGTRAKHGFVIGMGRSKLEFNEGERATKLRCGADAGKEPR